MHTQESGKGMKKLRNNKIRKLLAFMVALALMVSCMPSAYTISASEAFGDGTEDIFTDGEFTSEPAAEESTPDVSSADQEETEQAQQSTLTYENDSVKVTAEALEDGALPQNTALKADSVNENSSVSYDTVSQKLSAAATDKGSSLRGFFAYDVYFADGDGNRVEPNGRVRVTFEYKTPAAPELTDAASTSVTVEKLHYNSSTGDTDVNTLQANEDLKVLNVNEGKQIQTLQVETGNAAVFAVMWDSPETADVEAEAVSGNEDEVSIASEELTDGMDISDEPEQDAAETPAAENPEVTPDAEPSEAPAENPDAEPTEAPAEDPDVVEEPAEDIASPEEVPAADENGETSLIEVLGDDTNLRVSPSIEAEVLATVNAGTQFTLLDTVTAEDGATWYKVSWEGTEAYIYLERGKGDSNCKLKFNLPTVPDGSVKVQKQLSNTDKEKYADVKFKFQLLVKDEKENYVPSTPNGILDDGRKVEFSEDKVFTLKPGQYATFSGLKANTKYRIKELGVSKNEYDKVFINDEVTTSQDGNVISNEATVGSRPWVIFTNKCSEKNSRKLCITKKIKGDIPVNDKFDFEIKLNGQKYTGNYYLQDSEGNYYTSENGPLKKAKNKTVCGSAVNGVVSSVPAGYTVVLEQILAGTSFEVNEINLNPTDYGNPEYSIEAAEDVNTTDKASGKIELGSDAKVTVTNTRNNVASLEITKVNTSNQSLPGAKFTLTLDGDSAKTYNVTSDENGLLKFENLSVGTYTLTETEAPSGYVKSTESYKVKVSVENNKATAKLYKADGTNEIENKQIINYTEKEEAENNLTSSKTAKVVDYENRIYKINLNAETTGREGDVEAQGASVVMVLDASDSMNDSIANTNTSKLVALQNAANTFIDTLKSKSPESEIAIIWYSGSEGGNTSITNSKFKQLNNNEDVSSLKRTIDNKDASGGTPMGVALATARNQLSSAKHEKNKYVVFMTDGLPGHNNNDNWNCMVANNAVNNANSIKEQATLYTVGVGLNDAGSFNWKLGHSSTSSNSGHGYKYEYYRHKSITGSEFLSQYIATKSSDGTKKYAYDTSGLNDLVNTFNVIAGSIGDLFTVQPKEIVDVIDARFKLTDDGLNDLATNSRLGTGKIKTNNDGSKEIIWTDSTTGSVVGKVTIVERGDGTTKITWKEQAARIGNAATENENDKGWNASFRIQAKDDFIGGNMIPTNGADSGIYLDGGGIKKFEQPSVNVKLLSLSIGNDITTVFKGDPINTRNYGNVLAETIAVVELNGSTKTLTAVNPQDNGKVKLPELTKDQISNLSTDKVLIIGDNPDNLPYKYTYPGSNEAVGYFTYTYTLAKGDNADNHVATAVGNEVEKYKLTVTYYPYSKSDRSTILSGTGVQQPDAEKGGTQVNSNLEATGNYVVNVVAGSIQIIKKLDVVAEQDETFNFTITDEKNRTVATATATIKKDEPTATAVFTLAEGIDAKLESDNTKLSELSRGDYKVVESLGADVHYELQEIATVDGTNCHSVIARDQQQKATDITFTMGTDTDNKVVLRDGNNDVTNGQIGIAKFTNKKIVVDIELEKVDSQTTDTKLSGAEFALYKVDTSGNEIQVNSYTSEQRGKISIKNLPIGQYVLRETKAPTGYVKSAEPWNITVANDRTITVKYDGKDVASKPDNNKTIYQITNTKVYSLPESGGPGTYGFTISGVAILATALLLFINNKRREEEAKRS